MDRNDGSVAADPVTRVAQSFDPISTQDLINSIKDSLWEKGMFKHHGCNGDKCVKEMNTQLNVTTKGVDARTEYTNSRTGNPTTPISPEDKNKTYYRR